jgi:ABC-type nitrate/sulfonate/bicarbonate transport system substrate-binding protein
MTSLTPGMRRLRSAWFCLVLTAAVLCALVAATGSSESTRIESTKSANELTIAVPANFPAFTDVFIANQRGYFDAANVDVKLLTNTGANTATYLSSGQADLAMIGTTVALVLPPKGLSTTIIYGFLRGGEAGNVGISAGDRTTNIMGLSGKRVGTQGTGTASWGWASIFSNYVTKHGGQPFTIVPLPNLPSLLGSLQSGNIQAAIGAPSWFPGPQFKLLVNGSKPPKALSSLYGKGSVEAAIFGLTDNLRAKRPAVVAFIKAVHRADLWLKTANASTIAGMLHQLPEFATQDSSALTKAVAVERGFWAGGFITRAGWQRSLADYAFWNVPGVDIADPINAYARRVDMSYWKAANCKSVVKKVKGKKRKVEVCK